MSSIPQNVHNENYGFAAKFMKDFQGGRLLFECNVGKEKGIPVRQRFITLLSTRIICGFMKSLTSDGCKNVFIIDDSLYDCSCSRNTEPLAKVFDHCPMKFKWGYRMPTLG